MNILKRNLATLAVVLAVIMLIGNNIITEKRKREEQQLLQKAISSPVLQEQLSELNGLEPHDRLLAAAQQRANEQGGQAPTSKQAQQAAQLLQENIIEISKALRGKFDPPSIQSQQDISTGKWGFVEYGKWKIPAQFDSVMEFYPPYNFAAVRQNNKVGYIDTTGKWVIPAQFEDAISFVNDEGLAAAKQNGKWGFINTKGQWKIPVQFDELLLIPHPLNPYNKSHFVDGVAAVKKGLRWGYIDTTGKWQQPAFGSPSELRTEFYSYTHRSDIDGKGYTNRQGEWVIPPVFDYAYPFTDKGIARIGIQDKTTFKVQWGFIDTTGTLISDGMFDDPEPVFANKGLGVAKQNGI